MGISGIAPGGNLGVFFGYTIGKVWLILSVGHRYLITGQNELFCPLNGEVYWHRIFSRKGPRPMIRVLIPDAEWKILEQERVPHPNPRVIEAVY